MLKIGILGAARIAPKAMVHPAARRDDVTVTAVGARSLDRALSFADEHSIPTAVEGYEALVTHDAVDLVYNALPPSQHYQWSLMALEAGKHVLCEKPVAMNAREAKALVDAGQRTGRLFVEGFHYWYHPHFQRVLDILRTGMIGEPRKVTSHLLAHIPNKAGQIRYLPELGGGALMDLGCYALHWARRAIGEEPERIVKASARMSTTGVDVGLDAELIFPGGVSLELACSMEPVPDRIAFLKIEGTKGTLLSDNPLSPQNHNFIRVESDTESFEEEVAGLTTFDHQLGAMVTAVATGTPPMTSGADTINNMTWIDALYEAAKRHTS